MCYLMRIEASPVPIFCFGYISPQLNELCKVWMVGCTCGRSASPERVFCAPGQSCAIGLIPTMSRSWSKFIGTCMEKRLAARTGLSMEMLSTACRPGHSRKKFQDKKILRFHDIKPLEDAEKVSF